MRFVDEFRDPELASTLAGDMMRVPGSHGSLIDAKARGADVRFVHWPSTP